MAHATSLDLLEEEILRAKAEALGRAGEKLKAAVAAYRKLRESPLADGPERQLGEAWQRVMQAREVLIVLREGIGLRRHDSVDEEYDIPLRQRAE